MLSTVIKKISKEFITEARNSPSLLEDMASMEKYMAESYGERIFIELLQNSDDSKSTKVKMIYKNKNLYFANNGREFDEQDIVSISRSGSSSKKRGETIGYRGVGFKSTSYLSDSILIHSSDTYFTFSKGRCAKELNIANIEKVPTIRIPFLLNEKEVESKEEMNNIISSLKEEGFNTIFIFENARINLVNEEIKAIHNGYFLFLNNISSVEISVSDNDKCFNINRTLENNYYMHVEILGEVNQNWLIVVGDKKKKVDIAFKMDDEGNIIKCSSEEAIFHCYLPTLEKTGFPFKINSDFSTDPSRKHLVMDEETKKALISSAEVLFDMVKQVVNGSNNKVMHNIVDIINQKTSFAKFAMFLAESFTSLIKNNKWIRLSSGIFITPREYIKAPNWIEDSELNIIRNNSTYIQEISMPPNIYTNINNVDAFLSSFSTNEIGIDDWIEVLKDDDLVGNVSPKLIGKVYGRLTKEIKVKQIVEKRNYDITQCKISTSNGIYKMGKMKDIKDSLISVEFKEGYNETSTSLDSEWFDSKFDTRFSEFHINRGNDSIRRVLSPTKVIKTGISKWRAAEQQCIELEESFGNRAKDVSKQNLGYDIESVTPQGEIRYIEVKSISKSNQQFTMTNNEYSAAHHYGENYYICVVIQDDEQFLATYINKPLEALSFEKRARQWEWYCESYNGEQYKMEYI